MTIVCNFKILNFYERLSLFALIILVLLLSACFFLFQLLFCKQMYIRNYHDIYTLTVGKYSSIPHCFLLSFLLNK